MSCHHERDQLEKLGVRATWMLLGAIAALLLVFGVLWALTFAGPDSAGDALDQDSELAHHMDNLVQAAAREWGFTELRPHAALGDLGPGVLASTARYSVAECFVVFSVEAERWDEQMRWELALHEVGHCRWMLYPGEDGSVSQHSADPASIMHSPYRPGGRILESDRAATRPHRVVMGGIGR
jgi:hypothetical protein